MRAKVSVEPPPKVERFLLERTPEGRYQAVVLTENMPPFLVAARPGVPKTWSYLGPCIKWLETAYPEVTHYELRLRPLR